MDFEFELTQDDVVEVTTQMLKHAVEKRWLWKWLPYFWLFPGVGLVAVAFAGALWLDFDPGMPYFIGFVGAFMIFCYYFFPRWIASARTKTVRAVVCARPNALTGKHKVSITANAVRDTTARGQSSTTWATVSEVFCTKQYLLILTQDSNTYVVPRSSNSSDEEFNQLCEQAIAYQRNASKVTS